MYLREKTYKQGKFYASFSNYNSYLAAHDRGCGDVSKSVNLACVSFGVPIPGATDPVFTSLLST